MKTLKRLVAVIPAALLLVMSMASPAHATFASKQACTVSKVMYDAGRLVMNCSTGEVFYSFANNSSCAGSQGMDTLKMWEPIMIAAFLGGKKLNVGYEQPTASCGINVLWALELVP